MSTGNALKMLSRISLTVLTTQILINIGMALFTSLWSKFCIGKLDDGEMKRKPFCG
jgi:hypothetical protein